jgi:hypothetical protein
MATINTNMSANIAANSMFEMRVKECLKLAGGNPVASGI